MVEIFPMKLNRKIIFYTIELNEINKIKDLSIKKIHDSEI